MDETILAVETATRAASVAVVEAGRVRAWRALGERQASASLLVAVDAVLREADRRLQDVDLFAAAVGPGSFTGLRAGLATVRALARATGKRVAGVPTLHAVAAAEALPGARVSALLPAGRSELFCQVLRVVADGVEEEEAAWYARPHELWERDWGDGLVWVGEGARLWREEIARLAAARGRRWREGASGEAGAWTLAPAAVELASAVARLARRAGRAAPLYVRPADAELKGRPDGRGVA